MKLNIEIDCTPEEARRFMGLPDLTPVHDKYVSGILQTLENGVNPEMVEQMVKNWMPMGEAGMNIWREMVGQMGGKQK